MFSVVATKCWVGFIDWLGHALLNVDGDSDRWRSEDMLMVRVDHPTREEIPLTGFHVAQGWKLWHPLGVKPGCEKLGGVEFVHHVFRCGLGLRRVVNHGALTALEAVLAAAFVLSMAISGFARSTRAIASTSALAVPWRARTSAYSERM
jgi:hypothetical protein